MVDHSRADTAMSDDRTADGYNAGYAEQLYEKDLRQRGYVPPSLADWLGSASAAPVAPAHAPPADLDPAAVDDRLRTAAAAGSWPRPTARWATSKCRSTPSAVPAPGTAP